MTTIYLVDFDGTISIQDTLVYITQKFYPDKYMEWSNKIATGEYNIKDWIRVFEHQFNIQEDIYRKALDEVQIDPYFKEFIKEKEIRILSGGFDYNIKYIFKKFGIPSTIKIYANRLEFINHRKIKVSMDYFVETCPQCGVCKKKILYNYRKQYDKIIYIGDGISDLCVSEFADEIYAKKGKWLSRYLTNKHIPHNIFESFSEIK